MNYDIKCPILKKINEYHSKYEQTQIIINDKEIVVTKCFRGNSRCIVYICGFDDYFYHYHVVEEYLDLDFIAIDLPGFGKNKGYEFDNHLENMELLCDCLSKTIKLYCSKFEIVDILGFSMGGNIALYYVWSAERNYELFLPRKLLLLSPLVNFYIEWPGIAILATLLSRICYLFSNRIDLHYSYFDKETEDMLELEDIYSSEKLNKYEIEDFDINRIGGYHIKPFSNGTVVTVLNNINTMVNSTGITTETICLSSNKYGNEPLKEDPAVNPEDIKYYLEKICENLILNQVECGHQPLRQPYYTPVTFIDVCNFIFEK
jgi:hypothetical protein